MGTINTDRPACSIWRLDCQINFIDKNANNLRQLYKWSNKVGFVLEDFMKNTIILYNISQLLDKSDSFPPTKYKVAGRKYPRKSTLNATSIQVSLVYHHYNGIWRRPHKNYDCWRKLIMFDININNASHN